MENSLIVNFSYEDIRYYYSQKSYNERFFSTLFNLISPIVNSFLVVYVVICDYYKIKLSFLFKMLLSILFMTLLLGSRSYIFFLFIIASIVYYSVNKEKISIVDIFKFILVVFTTVYFIFPLVSSIRIIQRMVSFDGFSSNMGLFFNGLISNIIDNHVVLTEFSADSNNARSLSVFSSYMKSFTTSYQIGMGELSLNTFVHALPKILFPFKIFFEDAQILIEKKLGIFTDIGDSIPLFFKMEFDFWGSLFVVPFYCAVVFLWNKIRFVFEHISIDNLFLRYLYLYIILYMCVNVEVFIGTYISSIFTYVITIIIFKFIINRLMNVIVK